MGSRREIKQGREAVYFLWKTSMEGWHLRGDLCGERVEMKGIERRKKSLWREKEKKNEKRNSSQESDEKMEEDFYFDECQSQHA